MDTSISLLQHSMLPHCIASLLHGQRRWSRGEEQCNSQKVYWGQQAVLSVWKRSEKRANTFFSVPSFRFHLCSIDSRLNSKTFFLRIVAYDEWFFLTGKFWWRKNCTSMAFVWRCVIDLHSAGCSMGKLCLKVMIWWNLKDIKFRKFYPNKRSWSPKYWKLTLSPHDAFYRILSKTFLILIVLTSHKNCF